MSGGQRRILIADDEAGIRSFLRQVLAREGWEIFEAADGKAALDAIHRFQPDVVLSDFAMPGIDGNEVLRRAMVIDPDIPVVMLTGYATVEGAVEAVKDGAFWYLTKPCSDTQLVEVIERAFKEAKRRQRQRKPLHQQFVLEELMGRSEKIAALSLEVDRVAPTDFSVMVLGETGAGKEIVARAIHLKSRRAAAAFVAVDMGAVPETLVESEFFGHEKGAFTGAERMRPGKFELASGGTLFLDEISNLPFAMQGKLLRVLQEKCCTRIGGSPAIQVDVRVISATNRELNTSAAASFRSDLYHRLSEYVITVPPLRERADDIALLAQRFIDAANEELGKRVTGISEGALKLLASHSWPGNVRELRNVVRRAVLLAETEIDEQHLPAIRTTGGLSSVAVGEGAPELDDRSLWDVLRRNTSEVEARLIRQALRQAHGNKAEAARLLHVDYKTLHTKAKKYGITRD
jgi:two-component system nitrogen regulation response regulator GlnG